MEMFNEYSEDEQMDKIIGIFRKYDLTPDIVRKIADMIDPLDEKDELSPVNLKTNDISQLTLPDFHYLRRKLNMTSSTYKRTKGVWEGRGGQFDYSDNPMEDNSCTKSFYIHIDFSPTGRKRLYIGQMKNDGEYKTKTGKGIRIYEDGEFEEGYWLHNKQHYKGRCIYKMGGCYEGGFNQDDKHGKGTYIFLNGSRFEGYYFKDDRQGYGTEYNANGEVVKKGKWNDNVFQG